MPSPAHPASIRELFAQRCGRPGTVVARAPGRVNLIGEHTDYNDGFVLPMALEQATWVAAAPRNDDRLHALAVDLECEHTWSPGEWSPTRDPHWTSYIAGCAALLRQRGAALPGCDLVIHSAVPVGGGLSSSAALELATVLTLARLAGLELAPVACADLARAAEHDFAGVPCGIMDQYVSALAQAGCAFLLDCRTRTWEHIPWPRGDVTVLIVNSGVRHELAAGEYARRQEQCHAAVAHFAHRDPHVRALRDVQPDQVARDAAALGPVLTARARHVCTENARTLAAAEALRRHDLAAVGRLMAESHASLRDDYQVSCRELDRLVEIIAGVPGVFGVRMTGGGFGGSVVALLPSAAVPTVQAAVRAQYDAAGDGPAQFLVSRPGAGAALDVA